MILIPPGQPRGIVLFAPGAGGEPARYDALTKAAWNAGIIVTAPAHERFDARSATDGQIGERAVGLARVLDEAARPDFPVVAAGHSVGGWAALCLAGAQPRSRDGSPLPVPIVSQVSKVVALAPPLGWFRAPGALERLTVPVVVMMGASDVVTPPETAEILGAAPAEVTVRAYAGVGHLDFLTELPPTMAPTPGLDDGAFTAALAHDFVDSLDWVQDEVGGRFQEWGAFPVRGRGLRSERGQPVPSTWTGTGPPPEGDRPVPVLRV